MFEATLPLVESRLALPLFGAQDRHLQRIRDTFQVAVTHRNGQIRIAGEASLVAQATGVLEQLKRLVEQKGDLSEDEVGHVLAQHAGEAQESPPQAIEVLSLQKRVTPRTPGQTHYVQAVQKNSLVFAIGPAGTGKTYLAVAMAVEALKNKQVRKIVLCRPAVEAGESLGFLPGDLQSKINPYLRPLLDALYEMIDYDQVKRHLEQDVIEVVPLAYMRGRTLNEAFIILDEAQNSTVAQMKMFLTRMGTESRIVVSGDTTQIDLPHRTRSGLIDAVERLRGIKGIAHVQLSEKDIVRHRLVQEIVRAYDDVPARGARAKGRR